MDEECELILKKICGKSSETDQNDIDNKLGGLSL